MNAETEQELREQVAALEAERDAALGNYQLASRENSALEAEREQSRKDIHALQQQIYLESRALVIACDGDLDRVAQCLKGAEIADQAIED